MDRSRRILVGILTVLVLAISFARADESYRLPNNTRPTHYEIELIPYIVERNFTFDGAVTIDVTVEEATSTIVLHANKLEIFDDEVRINGNGVNYVGVNSTYNSTLHFYTIVLPRDLQPGDYSIYVRYTGILPNDMYGFYRSYYYTSSGEIRWLATTQFEATYARQAFPCFDEPAFKAKFTISIAHWPNQTAIANSATLNVSAPDNDIEGRVWTKFETTPLMSSYLVAFVVSDFGYQANSDESFKVWAREEALNTTTYAVRVGEKILEYLSWYTKINFTRAFQKMDQIAIPDFSAGAMENWGLVTYRERLLLYKDGVATSRNKQNIATVIAHEFAHQWFGNLVSPAWWKYTWLNEAFATYFELAGTAPVEPTWELENQFTVDNYQPALLTDSLDTSHPISDDVYTPSQVAAIFDTITYSKGGSLLRMLETILSTATFRNGLNRYLEKMAFGAATPDDLWEALELEKTENGSSLHPFFKVKTIMDTWTTQKGYPLVTVIRNYTTATQEITQERFLLKGRGSSNDTKSYRWWIPLTYATQDRLNWFDDPTPVDWMRAQDESVFISGFSPLSWIIFNVQQAGFYRVNYDETNWGLIADYLQTEAWSKIHVLNRAQLIDDALNLARAKYLNYKVALPITRYLTRETHYSPWTSAFTGFNHLNTMLASSEAYQDFKDYVLSLVAPIHEALGFEERPEDTHTQKLLRLNANSWACKMGSLSCQNKAEELLLEYYADPNPTDSTISPDLKAWVYCEGLRKANVSVWNFLWKRYLSTDFSGEQTLILSSLGCSQNEEILNNYLALSISPNSTIRSQDTYSIFSSVYTSSPSNVDVAFDFLAKNYEAISEFYGGMNRIGSILNGLASRVVSTKQLDKLRAFVLEHEGNLGDAASSALQAMEVAEENLSWLASCEVDIGDWLAKELGRSGANRFGSSVILATAILAVLRFF
ncbi:aminopeptidase N-like [Athalia rosae]|uniref:aminopeptidase N-like n=1 Tax=Athalia rosae TaxID=37344 RepID=UPI0020343A16|nr:aminopeptidase N-like [Athalia rosae]